MPEPKHESDDRVAIARALDGHRIDGVNQDSGQHCICGSDSRFEQRDGDHPWRSIGEHRADMVLRSIRSGAGRHVLSSPAGGEDRG